jgi:hypothetical protein
VPTMNFPFLDLLYEQARIGLGAAVPELFG